MTTENIELARTGNVATVTLARPEKLNALTAGMWAGLRTAFETVAADGAVRVVVLRGAGGRAFCVGADIGEFERTRAGKTQAVAYAEVVHGIDEAGDAIAAGSQSGEQRGIATKQRRPRLPGPAAGERSHPG